MRRLESDGIVADTSTSEHRTALDNRMRNETVLTLRLD